jgi:uracil-DNA glycosylase
MKLCPNQFPLSLPPDGQVKIAFVGEAPGRDEETAGIPFIGAAGRELDNWIKPFFLRSQAFIGNLSQERPPDNKLENWFLDSKNTIPNERLKGWIDVLRGQLEQIRPNLIIALGRHPCFILTGKDGITNYWGSILPCTLVPGLKVIPLLHPSFVMRGMFDLRPVIRVWLKRAKQQSAFPEYRPPVRELVVDPPLETVYYELDRLMAAPELAFDIETIPNKKIQYTQGNYIYTPDILTCISFSDSPNWSISIPFNRAGGQHRWTMDVEAEVWRRIARLLGQPGPLKIAHNLMFDFLQLAGRQIFVAPPYYDTMAAHNRAYLDLTKKKLKKLQMNRLAFCTAFYTEEAFYKNDHKDENKGDDWRGADREFWIYNAKDSAVLHEIKAGTWRDLTELGMAEMFEGTMREFKPLACMGIQGVRRDRRMLYEEYQAEEENQIGLDITWKGLDEYVEDRIKVLQTALNTEVGYELNTKSSKQMQRFLYTELGLPIQIKKDTGRPSADEGSIAKLYQKTKHPILKKLTELTRLRGFKSNYMDAAIGLDDRSRTTYNQAKTCTSRVSSSDAIIGEGKNLQTIPSRSRPGELVYNRLIKEYKQTFMADEGKVMFKRDYCQAEAMVVAWLAEDLQQISDFLDGVDIHCRTVEMLYGCSYEDALNGYKNGDPVWKTKRDLGKPARHGFNYKLGEITLSQMYAMSGMDVPPRECKRLLQAMRSSVPAVVRWQREVEDTLHSTRTITNPLGLRRTFLGVIDNDCIREAIAFNPQSTVGMLLNKSLDRIYHTPGLINDVDFLLQQHDALIAQADVDKVKECAEWVGRLMAIPLHIKGRELIIPTDLEVGKTWGSLKKPGW